MKAPSKIAVLLVDDHPIVREGYRLLLGNTKDIHVVGEAENGEQACLLYSEVSPDVVILDLNMPGMGGLEVLKRIRNINPKIGIIMTTAVIDEEIAKSTIRLGAYDYITKPIDLNHLETVLMVKMIDIMG